MRTPQTKRRAALLAAAAAAAMFGAGCARSYSAAEIEAWVVDADTGHPLEGVNVVAHWALEFGMEGGQQRDLEMLEAVTDRNGRFHFPAWGPKRVPTELPWNAYLQHFDPEIIFFKPGYRWRAVHDDRGGPPHATGGPSRRTSPWHGRKIPLKKYDGPPEDYGSAVSGVLTGVSWGRCGWTKIPMMMASLVAQSERFDARGQFHYLPTLSDIENTARGENCRAVPDLVRAGAKR